MKNFEQIRAKNALDWKDKIRKGKGDGENVAKKVPVMILDNGIIAAAAFALEKDEGYADVFRAIACHLKDSNIQLLESTFPSDSLKNLITHLTTRSSSELRLITAETIAFLNYLRRFVKKEKKGKNDA